MKDAFDGFLRRLSAGAIALFATLAVASPLSAAETTTIDGTLSVRWGDPHPSLGSGGGTFFRLQADDGRSLPIEITPQLASVAITAHGRHVRVGGTAGAGIAGEQSFQATSLTVLPSPQDEQLAPAALTTKKVLFILLKYKSDAQTPHSATFYKNLTNLDTASTGMGIPAAITQFYKATSYGRLAWKGDVAGVGGLAATGWLTLPKTKTGYANCGWKGTCADLDGIAADALALVKAQGVNVTAYDNLAFVLNDDLDCCAWGGGYTYGGKHYGATWEPPWGQEAGTYVHEFGHSIGLPHSGWVYYAYDSPWDQMSRGTKPTQLVCGSYNSANSSNAVTKLYCSEPGSGFLTPYKAYLGWVPASNIKTISTVSTTTVALEETARPLGTAYKEVKICLKGEPCTGTTAHYLSVEARIANARYERGLPGNGVVIHDVKMNRSSITSNSCFFNLQFGWAMTIDSTPRDYDSVACSAGGRAYPNYGLYNAQFGVGKTYSNTTLGVKVQVVSSSSTGYTVKVTKSK